MRKDISRQRILIVEDDYHLATEFSGRLVEMGAEVAGPVPAVNEAMELLRSADAISGGVLDINLAGEMVFPVADELERRAIPFIFATGYDPDIVPARHADKVVLRKPLEYEAVISALLHVAKGDGVSRQEALANALLCRLSSADLDRVLPHLRRVHLPRGAILERRGQTVSRVYFPLDCVGSLIAIGSEGTRIETGLIGREGMTGHGLIVGDDQTPYELINQIEGSALAMSAEDFCRLSKSVLSLQLLAARFGRSLNLQVSYAAMANGKFEMRQRLARWLLMMQDRTQRTPYILTHDYIATMLGVRRPSVTDTLHILEGERLIRSTRSQIEIVNRKGLIAMAGEIYGIPEKEYSRLMALPLLDS